MNINIKLRKGAEEGLKFKRFKKRKGNIEQWLEDSGDIFQFPLDSENWQILKKELQTETDVLPSNPTKPLTPSKVIGYLQQTGYEMWEVQKNRGARLLNVSNGKVKVEWCCISKPRSIISVGLENWSETGDQNSREEKKVENIKEAIETLDLHKQPLKIMNYLDALDCWANDQDI